MKKFIIVLLLVTSSKTFACGGDYYNWLSFYTIFNQKSISDSTFYPFLRDADSKFYDINSYDYYSEENMIYNHGNIKLWHELLSDWSEKDINNAVYSPTQFKWNSQKGQLLKRAKLYIDYANFCSNTFAYRHKLNSWNYEEIISQNNIEDLSKVLAKGIELFDNESNQQLKSRYGYQVVRILHYSKKWKDAIMFFDAKIKGKFPKNEIYYYTIDQVAGCYYSLKSYDKAAFLFTKVINHSEDRKKSAFNSFEFCLNYSGDGASEIKKETDKKDYQFIKGLKGFSDETNSIVDFIKLDANDHRIEVLFARSINNLESKMLTRNYGLNNVIIPYFEVGSNLNPLLNISLNQTTNDKVKNKDYWLIANSYLNFLNQDFVNAINQLNKVKNYPEQKNKLAAIYEVFSWDKITPDNEDYLLNVLNKHPKKNNAYGIENDFQNLIIDFIAHRYYHHDEIAKSFLVHNFIESANDISSLRLIDNLERFYNKKDKTDFEKSLLTQISAKHNFSDYINHLKAVYYLHNFDPEMAMEFFNNCTTPNNDVMLSASLFSNNTIECFNCNETDVMEDLVYEADIFNFIKSSFNVKELTSNLIRLEKLTKDETQWKAKLANYLLGNYYFNISNTGYYRGALTNRYANDNAYFGYYHDEYKDADEIIQNKKGYNMSDISFYPKNYFGLSLVAANYYKNVIEMSTDKELNARCLYLIAKCELNQLYNGKDIDTYQVQVSKYNKLVLPVSQAFYELKNSYSDTKFHDMIIEECAYFKYYSERY